METWIEWGGFPCAPWTSEPPIILSFFWSEILSGIQEKPSFKTGVCVPTRISNGGELTFSKNTQPLLHILNYVVVFWSGQAFYSVCDVQINIFFFLSIFWLISPIHFLFQNLKKMGDVLNFCIFRLFQEMTNLNSTSVVEASLRPHSGSIWAGRGPQPGPRMGCPWLPVHGKWGQRELLGSLPCAPVGFWSRNDGAKDMVRVISR